MSALVQSLQSSLQSFSPESRQRPNLDQELDNCPNDCDNKQQRKIKSNTPFGFMVSFQGSYSPADIFHTTVLPCIYIHIYKNNFFLHPVHILMPDTLFPATDCDSTLMAASLYQLELDQIRKFWAGYISSQFLKICKYCGNLGNVIKTPKRF